MAIDKTTRAWIGVAIVVLIVLIGSYRASFTTTNPTANVVALPTTDDDIQIQVEQEVQQPIILGFMGPLTGDAAAYGQSIQRGVELAMEDLQVEGVSVVIEDSKCDGREAVTVINKLISVNNAAAIIGEVCSGATLAAAPIAEQQEVVLISASSTSPDITGAGDFIFRTVPSDALQGAFGADLVRERGHETLAILYGNEDYGVGFKDVLEDSFTGSVVATEAFERGTADMRTQLAKIQAENPDAIYIISNSPDSAVAALEQITELGIDAEVFGSEGLKSDAVLEAAGTAAEGLIVTSVSFGNDAFTAAHVVKYGEAPGPFAAQAFDAFTALAAAIDAGATTGPEIRDALYELSFQGVSGTIDFDTNGDIAGNYNIEQVQEGAFVTL